MFETNVMGSVLIARAVLPDMRTRGRGTIVLVGSRRGLEPKSGTTAYSASKAAVLALARALADEVGIAGVKVCYVAPGGTKTGLATPKDPRFLEPAAVAEAIAFVCESGADTWVRDLTVLPLGL